MMQAMEFNSAWSQNMTEFERQAADIEEQALRKQQQEFAEFQERIHSKEQRTYKFSRDLLLMKTSVESLAKQGRYDEAHKLKRKAEQLEKWERMKLDNEVTLSRPPCCPTSRRPHRISSHLIPSHSQPHPIQCQPHPQLRPSPFSAPSHFKLTHPHPQPNSAQPPPVPATAQHADCAQGAADAPTTPAPA